jgi:hypothetical protein
VEASKLLLQPMLQPRLASFGKVSAGAVSRVGLFDPLPFEGLTPCIIWGRLPSEWFKY